MGTVATIEYFYHKISVGIRKRLVTVSELKNIKQKRQLIEKTELSEQQKNEIDLFYLAHYGKKIRYDWHRLYQSYTGKYHVDYFPEILMSTKLEPQMNPYWIAEFLGDKNLLQVFFGNVDVHIPRTLISSVNGLLRDGDNNIINYARMSTILSNENEYVIKKTIETSSGRDVLIVKSSEHNLEEVLPTFGKNFVIQELIVQCKELAKLNDTSLNTFRVITYILNNQIFVCPIALRMGRSKADRDNIHYGGISVGVNECGKLKKFAFSEYGERYEMHPDSKVIFEDYSIPAAGEKMRLVAKKLHEQIPYLGILSWDLSVDDEGNIVLIEVNTIGQAAWLCQMVNGEPLFGENTSAILQMIQS